MLTFKDLIIKASKDQIKILIEMVTKKTSKTDLWSRDQDKENIILGVEKVYGFKRIKDQKSPSAGLSIFPKDENSWYVPNIFPLEYGQLSHQEYNDILTEFYELFIKPVSDRLNIGTELSSGEVTEVNLLGKEGAKLLSIFSSSANKSTGSSHPLDKQRWMEFICEVCNSDKQIDIGLLGRLLMEQDWDEESAHKLSSEFEFSQDLLEYEKGRTC